MSGVVSICIQKMCWTLGPTTISLHISKCYKNHFEIIKKFVFSAFILVYYRMYENWKKIKFSNIQKNWVSHNWLLPTQQCTIMQISDMEK